ncbi:MAG: FecR domain-containing protein [Cyclobacteriaceae bacterium]
MPDHNQQVHAFLLDPHFQAWVKTPNNENNAYWQEFLRLHPEAAEDIEEARNLILQLDFHEEPRSEATKQRIKSTIDRAIQEKALPKEALLPPEIPPFRKIAYPRQWIGVAASLTGVILLAVAYFIAFQPWEPTEYTTTYGETKTVTLPDQSVVTLNANSSLRIAEADWENLAERKVWLTGEAFFDVEKRKTREGEPAKFLVHSGNVRVEVLGTRFNVNSRHRETKVVLSSGKVKLNIEGPTEQANEEVLMVPGEMVAVDQHQQAVEKKTVDPSHYTAWTENKLVFENTPIAAIKQLIEDNYGLQVSIEDPNLLLKAFTGTAPADDLDILLDKLSLVYRLKITRSGNEITITEK